LLHLFDELLGEGYSNLLLEIPGWGGASLGLGEKLLLLNGEVDEGCNILW
jgi:hypothetical protein